MIRRNIIFATVCALSLMAGIGLGSHGLKERSLSQGQPAMAKSGSRGEPLTVSGKLTSPQDREQALRAMVARCDTAVLWDWLATAPEGDYQGSNAVITELMDRLGWRAFDHALGIGDEKLRHRLSNRILGLFALKDPWKAFEIYKEHRNNFNEPRWGRFALEGCISAAADLSADRMLEVFAEMPSKESETFMNVAYRADFDFKRALDFLLTTKEPPASVPENLISEWAKRSPSEAAGWLSAHPEFINHEIIEYRGRVVLETIAASSDREERERALEAASRLPAPFLDKAWSEIGEQQKGVITPDLLEAAGRMGRREEFLTAALLSTNQLEKVDASWRSIPAAERMAILEAAESKWAGQVDTPLVRRAREGWREMVLQAWQQGD